MSTMTILCFKLQESNLLFLVHQQQKSFYKLAQFDLFTLCPLHLDPARICQILSKIVVHLFAYLASLFGLGTPFTKCT